jgi:hypothetical protein
MCYNEHMGKGMGPGSQKTQFQRRLDYAQVLKLYRELGTQRRVAERLGSNQGTISGILRSQGVRVGVGPVTKYDLPMDEIASRYLAGETCREIAKDYGVDDERIRRRLKSKGVTRRNGGGPKGSKNFFWKGGFQPTMHYYRRQSYEVAAICLGYPLPQGMIIHHLDENPRNNNPDNLCLFENQGDHARFHLRLHNLQRTGQKVDAIQTALENGGRELPPPPAPISLPLGTSRRDPSRKRRSQGMSPTAS